MSSTCISPSLEINSHVWTDPIKTARKFYVSAFKAEAKAHISFIATTIIALISIAFTSMYMPFFVPVVLVISGSIMKCAYNKFYLFYKNESLKNTEFAQHSLGIAKKINEYARKKLIGTDFVDKLYEFGIIPREIKHKDTLEAMDPNQDTYRSLRNLIGRVEYWLDTAKQLEKKIQNLNEEIQQKDLLIHSPGISIKEKQKARSSWLLLHVKKHKIEEEKLLPCKLAAAFNLHVIDNIKDTQSFSSFGTPLPSSYLDAITWKDSSNQPYYFFKEDTKRAPLSKKWLMDHSIQKIAKKLFGVPSLRLA